MPNITESQEMVKKVLPIIYVIDTSGSMNGEKIAAVNEAMHETVDVLKDVSSKNPDAEVKIAVLSFSSGAQWVTNENSLEDLEDFVWTDITAGGITDLGYAISELEHKLSRQELLKSEVGFCIPVILFMTDGQPTDNYQKPLKKANKDNTWFRHATKIGIAVGDDADENVLAEVVGNPEAVIKIHDNDTLKKLIRIVSVSSSMVNSKSRTSADTDNAKDIIDQTMKEMSGQNIEQGCPYEKKTDNTNSDKNPNQSVIDDSDW